MEKRSYLAIQTGLEQNMTFGKNKLLRQLHQLTTSRQPVTKFEVKFYETHDKSVNATILISLINGIVKWWNYDNLSLYFRFDVNYVIDFSYYKDKGIPHISLLTKNRYIHVFKLEDFWKFSKITKVKLK